MMAEDYVSFEVAKLLNEKGFDEKCISVYHDGELRLVSSLGIFCGAGILAEQTLTYTNSECKWSPIMISAPTLQMAMKWLRKVHEIFIRPNINFLYPIRYYCEIFCYGDNLKTQQDVKTENFESPEQACEAAIKYCLENLI